VSCLSLLGESSKASELRIRSVFENARQVSPAILYLTDIEVSSLVFTCYLKRDVISIYP
jgi:AAA+ superfamily predicted ATPase